MSIRKTLAKFCVLKSVREKANVPEEQKPDELLIEIIFI